MKRLLASIMICALLLIGCTNKSSEPPDAPPPERSEIAFNRGGSIFLIDTHTEEETVLVANNHYDRPIQWTPNGDRLIYWNHDGGAWDLWAIEIATKQKTNLTRSASDSRSASPSPDGKKIAFQRGGKGVWIMDANGENQTQIDRRGHRDAPPVWSPSGQSLAFTDLQTVGQGSQRMAVYLVRNVQTETPVVSEIASGESQCFLDERTLLITGRLDNKRELIAIDIDTLKAHALTNSPQTDFSPALSADRTTLAWEASGDETSHLMVMNLRDGIPRTLCKTSNLYYAPSFSPDGKHIAFESGDERGALSIFIIAVSGGNPRMLCGPGCSAPLWRQIPPKAN